MRPWVTGLVALARGEAAQAAELAVAVLARVAATGCELYRAPAERLAQATRYPPATVDLPRLLRERNPSSL
jgi:hypothetical protein